MEEPCCTPHSVLVIESLPRQPMRVSDNGRKVPNVMGGIIPLWNEHVPKNERGSAITHCQKLTTQELKSFFALDVVVIGQRGVIRLKPIASVRSEERRVGKECRSR